LSGLLTLLIVYAWPVVAGRRVGLVAVVVLATSWQFLDSTHWIRSMRSSWFLRAGVLVGMGARLGHGGIGFVVLLYGSLGPALWTKGLVGRFRPGGLAAYCVLERRERHGFACVPSPERAFSRRPCWPSSRPVPREEDALYTWDGQPRQRFLNPQATGHRQPSVLLRERAAVSISVGLSVFDVFRPTFWRGRRPALR